MMGKKTPDQLLYEATRNAAQRPLLNRLEALETISREQREHIAALKKRIAELESLLDGGTGMGLLDAIE
jgi:ribosome assembly protein YihI (activator of Der GTPase)